MNFEYSEEQLMIQKTARDYAQRELIKDVTYRDTNAIYPTEHVKNIAQLGFFGMMHPVSYTHLRRRRWIGQ